MLYSVSVFFAVVALVSGSYPHGGVSTQYHAQDELGQYSYGYAGGPSSKTETKTADGVVKGAYSYVDGHGLVQSASYVSDPHNGFRVAATNLPVSPAAPVPVAPAIPVVPLPAAPVVAPAPIVKSVVAPAPAVYAAPAPGVYAAPAPAVYAAAAPAIYAAPAVHAGPVVYAAGYIPGVETPEVTIAKAAHIAAVHETKALLHSWRRKRSVIAPHAYGAYPYGYAGVPKGFAYSSVTHHYQNPSYSAYVSPYAAPYAAAPAYVAAPAYAVAPGYAAAPTYPSLSGPVASPYPVKDTPEVAIAKAAHLATVQETKAKVGAAATYPVYPYAGHYAASYVPVPVTDTPEVAHAKAAHLAAVHEAKAKAYAHPYY